MAMVDRTKKWLLGRRDGKGGFLRNPKALDNFGAAPESTTNAYIVWSLVEAGMDLKDELNAVAQECKASTDPYYIGLAACSLYTLKRNEEAEQLAEKLISFQQPSGLITNAPTTITRSSGDGKDIETTSIAILAWLKNHNKFENYASKALEALVKFCKVCLTDVVVTNRVDLSTTLKLLY